MELQTVTPLPPGFRPLSAPRLADRIKVMPMATPPPPRPAKPIGAAFEALILGAGFKPAPTAENAAATFSRTRSSATCCTLESLSVRFEALASGGHCIRVTLDAKHSVVREFGNSHDWNSFTTLDLDSATRVQMFANLLNGAL